MSLHLTDEQLKEMVEKRYSVAFIIDVLSAIESLHKTKAIKIQHLLHSVEEKLEREYGIGGAIKYWCSESSFQTRLRKLRFNNARGIKNVPSNFCGVRELFKIEGLTFAVKYLEDTQSGVIFGAQDQDTEQASSELQKTDQ